MPDLLEARLNARAEGVERARAQARHLAASRGRKIGDEVLPESRDVRAWAPDPPYRSRVRWPPPKSFLKANPAFKKIVMKAQRYEKQEKVIEAVSADPRIGNEQQPDRKALSMLKAAMLRDLCDEYGLISKGIKIVLIERLYHAMKERAKELRREARKAGDFSGRELRGENSPPFHPSSLVKPPRDEEERERLRDMSAKLGRPVVAPTRRKRSMPYDVLRLLSPEKMCEVLSKAHAVDVHLLDVRDQAEFCDEMVVATGSSPEHLQTLANALLHEVKKSAKRRLVRPHPHPEVQGGPGSFWVVVDFGAAVVHLFLEEARQEYNLEELWADEDGGNVKMSKPQAGAQAGAQEGVGGGAALDAPRPQAAED